MTDEAPFPVGMFFHYLTTEEEAAAKRIEVGDNRMGPGGLGRGHDIGCNTSDPKWQGIVDRVGEGVLWVRLFSFSDGSAGSLQALPIGDWSAWRFFDTDEAMRDAWAWHGYLRGWWNHDDYEFMTKADDTPTRGNQKAMPSSRVAPRRVQSRTAITKARRYDVLQRGGFRCTYCGRSASDIPLHIDHIVPLSKGGSDDDANLVPACPDCNGGKRDRLVPTESLPSGLS